MRIDGWSAPGDPLFYLHQGNLDRVWAKWQSADPVRLTDIGGYTTAWPPFTNTTLDFMMPFTTLQEPIAIRDVMNTESYPWCFKYDY
ncbi:tyrosinase central domain-containing protein [Coprinopsis cinerea AmutBmut pab1-1]|nr:tyrosinase central domain-containing protein [Coprinopsis cinerea AmutBmut pab1-1]